MSETTPEEPLSDFVEVDEETAPELTQEDVDQLPDVEAMSKETLDE